MEPTVESTERKAADYIIFAITFFGNILAAAGVVATCIPMAVLGAALMLFGSVSLLIMES